MRYGASNIAEPLPLRASALYGSRGFSITEILVVLSIFSIILAGVYSAYESQLKSSTREYRYAETDMELGIARNIMERDLAMAGYGLADDYSAVTGVTLNPVVARAVNDNPDTLTVMGTALGTRSRAAQGWTYMTAVGGGVPTFKFWSDPREDVRAGDAVILLEPSTRKLLVAGTNDWLFRYNGTAANSFTADLTYPPGASPGTAYSNDTSGTIVYGLQSADDSVTNIRPYHAVRYYLDNTNMPSKCAPDTFRLMRAESNATDTPAGGDPLIPCVLDFQVAYGVDSNEDGTLDLWDDGGAAAALYSAKNLRKKLRQIRVYLLVQTGNRENEYTYPAASVRVGEAGLGSGLGRDVSLTEQQKKYRWRVMSLNVTPRNSR